MNRNSEGVVASALAESEQVREKVKAGWQQTDAEPRILWVLLLVGLCALVFVGLAMLINAHTVQQFDREVLVALRDSNNLNRTIGPRWVQLAAADLTALGSVPVLTLCTTAVIGFLLMKRGFRTAIMLVVVTLAGGGLGQLLKGFFMRSRPSVVPHLAEVSSASFPSGHSMMSAVVYMTLAVVAASTLEGRRERLYMIVLGILVSTTVGFTRMLLGVHYPTDVLAGWTLGLGWALGCWAAARYLQRRHVIEDPGPQEV